MCAPGKILSVRDTTSVALVDIQGGVPAITPAAPLSTARKWGFGTVLADGTMWVNGGSVDANVLPDAVYSSELFDPATGQWTVTASAQRARMYHSSEQRALALAFTQDGQTLTVTAPASATEMPPGYYMLVRAAA
jgi:hypothetical protein